ncbi:hypothetical protein B0A55_05712 [Friedmanniomyces simplex]|uniref:Uncharacterized protein n=1 Tax=Friedmanniomyces simplex TaxID=329884 RepID=A0A4U0XCQ1_9PEZI|nr:hypothetical protein B0A55_05712 [Friedmanniomyces simplex]
MIAHLLHSLWSAACALVDQFDAETQNACDEEVSVPGGWSMESAAGDISSAPTGNGAQVTGSLALVGSGDVLEEAEQDPPAVVHPPVGTKPMSHVDTPASPRIASAQVESPLLLLNDHGTPEVEPLAEVKRATTSPLPLLPPPPPTPALAPLPLPLPHQNGPETVAGHVSRKATASTAVYRKFAAVSSRGTRGIVPGGSAGKCIISALRMAAGSRKISRRQKMRDAAVASPTMFGARVVKDRRALPRRPWFLLEHKPIGEVVSDLFAPYAQMRWERCALPLDRYRGGETRDGAGMEGVGEVAALLVEQDGTAALSLEPSPPAEAGVTSLPTPTDTTTPPETANKPEPADVGPAREDEQVELGDAVAEARGQGDGVGEATELAAELSATPMQSGVDDTPSALLPADRAQRPVDSDGGDGARSLDSDEDMGGSVTSSDGKTEAPAGMEADGEEQDEEMEQGRMPEDEMMMLAELEADDSEEEAMPDADAGDVNAGHDDQVPVPEPDDVAAGPAGDRDMDGFMNDFIFYDEDIDMSLLDDALAVQQDQAAQPSGDAVPSVEAAEQDADTPPPADNADEIMQGDDIKDDHDEAGLQFEPPMLENAPPDADTGVQATGFEAADPTVNDGTTMTITLGALDLQQRPPVARPDFGFMRHQAPNTGHQAPAIAPAAGTDFFFADAHAKKSGFNFNLAVPGQLRAEVAPAPAPVLRFSTEFQRQARNTDLSMWDRYYAKSAVQAEARDVTAGTTQTVVSSAQPGSILSGLFGQSSVPQAGDGGFGSATTFVGQPNSVFTNASGSQSGVDATPTTTNQVPVTFGPALASQPTAQLAPILKPKPLIPHLRRPAPANAIPNNADPQNAQAQAQVPAPAAPPADDLQLEEGIKAFLARTDQNSAIDNVQYDNDTRGAKRGRDDRDAAELGKRADSVYQPIEMGQEVPAGEWDAFPVPGMEAAENEEEEAVHQQRSAQRPEVAADQVVLDTMHPTDQYKPLLNMDRGEAQDLIIGWTEQSVSDIAPLANNAPDIVFTEPSVLQALNTIEIRLAQLAEYAQVDVQGSPRWNLSKVDERTFRQCIHAATAVKEDAELLALHDFQNSAASLPLIIRICQSLKQYGIVADAPPGPDQDAVDDQEPSEEVSITKAAGNALWKPQPLGCSRPAKKRLYPTMAFKPLSTPNLAKGMIRSTILTWMSCSADYLEKMATKRRSMDYDHDFDAATDWEAVRLEAGYITQRCVQFRHYATHRRVDPEVRLRCYEFSRVMDENMDGLSHLKQRWGWWDDLDGAVSDLGDLASRWAPDEDEED